MKTLKMFQEEIRSRDSHGERFFFSRHPCAYVRSFETPESPRVERQKWQGHRFGGPNEIFCRRIALQVDKNLNLIVSDVLIFVNKPRYKNYSYYKYILYICYMSGISYIYIYMHTDTRKIWNKRKRRKCAQALARIYRDCVRTTLILANIPHDIKFSQLWNYTNK